MVIEKKDIFVLSEKYYLDNKSRWVLILILRSENWGLKVVGY